MLDQRNNNRKSKSHIKPRKTRIVNNKKKIAKALPPSIERKMIRDKVEKLEQSRINRLKNSEENVSEKPSNTEIQNSQIDPCIHCHISLHTHNYVTLDYSKFQYTLLITAIQHD